MISYRRSWLVVPPVGLLSLSPRRTRAEAWRRRPYRCSPRPQRAGPIATNELSAERKDTLEETAPPLRADRADRPEEECTHKEI